MKVPSAEEPLPASTLNQPVPYMLVTTLSGLGDEHVPRTPALRLRLLFPIPLVTWQLSGLWLVCSRARDTTVSNQGSTWLVGLVAEWRSGGWMTRGRGSINWEWRDWQVLTQIGKLSIPLTNTLFIINQALPNRFLLASFKMCSLESFGYIRVNTQSLNLWRL